MNFLRTRRVRSCRPNVPVRVGRRSKLRLAQHSAPVIGVEWREVQVLFMMLLVTVLVALLMVAVLVLVLLMVLVLVPQRFLAFRWIYCWASRSVLPVHRMTKHFSAIRASVWASLRRFQRAPRVASP